MKKITILLLVFAPFLAFAQNIPMTFHNGSFFPIYLSIPGVMNPNLVPKLYVPVQLCTTIPGEKCTSDCFINVDRIG